MPVSVAVFYLAFWALPRKCLTKDLPLLQEKYAEGGYLKLWIPESDNAARLAELRALIADEVRKRAAFEQIYQSLYSSSPVSHSSSFSLFFGKASL